MIGVKHKDIDDGAPIPVHLYIDESPIAARVYYICRYHTTVSDITCQWPKPVTQYTYSFLSTGYYCMHAINFHQSPRYKSTIVSDWVHKELKVYQRTHFEPDSVVLVIETIPWLLKVYLEMCMLQVWLQTHPLTNEVAASAWSDCL